MTTKKTINSITRCLGVNATLSTVSVSAFENYSPLNESISVAKKPAPSPKVDAKPAPKETLTMKEEKNTKKAENNSANTTPPNKDKSSTPAKAPISKLSIIAIALTLGLGGFIYLHGHQQAVAQKATIAQLQSEISSLKSALKDSIEQDIRREISDAVTQQNQQITTAEQSIKQSINEQQSAQTQFTNQVNDALKVTEKNIVALNERLTAMSNTDTEVWLISQANYLINLAGRKIWNEQDYVTAALLLKNADASLAQANDPSLLPARKALSQDIAALAKINYTDLDGIVMTLMGLSDSLTELPLVDNYQDVDLGLTDHDDSFNSDNSAPISDDSTTSDSTDLTSSIADWSDNLVKSGQSFFSKFIQIEKYDGFSDCVAAAGQDATQLEKCQVHKALITPEQALYLRENIRLRLFIAAQAVPRHQELIYERALSDVNTWVTAYFDTNSPAVKVFLNELTDLQQQSISNQDVPEQLSSQPELNKLMQSRVRSMLAN